MRWPQAAIAASLLCCLFANAESFKRPLIFGVNPEAEYELFKDDATYRDVAWQRLAEAGCRLVRLQASWREIEAERGKRDWSELDAQVYRARQIDAEPLITIVNTPGWASPTGKPTGEYPSKEEMSEEFQKFCEECAARYKGLARYYEFWSKQNGRGWHTDQGFMRADEYIPWLRRAYQALKRGNPECRVALGGLDDADGFAWAYLKKFYRFRNEWFPGEDFFDAVAVHPSISDIETLEQSLTKVRDVMAENGDGAKPLWITEYGWALPDSPEDQAANLKAFLDAVSSPEMDWVELAAYQSLANSSSGLCDPNLRTRPAFAAMRDHPLSERPFFHGLTVNPAGVGALDLKWRTRQPATSRIEPASGDSPPPVIGASPPATEHSAVLTDLPPGGRLNMRLAGSVTNGSELTSLPFALMVPASGVQNGDFESGIRGGIAEGWTIAGGSYCYDSSHPFLKLVHGGSRAQVIQISPQHGNDSAALMRGKACVSKGLRYRLSAWTVCPDDGAAIPSRRVGVDAAGGDDSAAPGIRWSDPVRSSWSWTESAVDFAAESNTVTIYVSVQPSEGMSAESLVYIDDVAVKEAGAE